MSGLLGLLVLFSINSLSNSALNNSIPQCQGDKLASILMECENQEKKRGLVYGCHPRRAEIGN
jgi:hypothetical protein